jgi:hypothetical protein
MLMRSLCRALLCAGVVFSTLAANRDPAQWAKEIQAFEARDRTNPPPKGGVLFIGSSSIRLWTNLAEAFPNLRIVQRGFGGSHMPDSTAYAERIIFPYEPGTIVVYAGENDIARGDSPREVFEAFKQFVAKVRTRLPKTKIYFISIKPAPVRWHLSPQEREANRLIQKYCRWHRGLEFINIWNALLNENGQPEPTLYQPDNLHLNQKGYALWKEIIGAALEQKKG